MVNYYSNHQHKSVNLILDIYSSDIFDGITWIMRPVVGAVDYLKVMHRKIQIQRELNKLSSLEPETREKLLDTLTDIASIDFYKEDFEEIQKKIEDKISNIEEFDKIFKQLKTFTDGLDHSQRNLILRHSLVRLNGRITSIRDEIKSRIWDKNEDSNQLLVLDQIFFLIQELIKETTKEVNEPKNWFLIAFSLFKIEALHRDKITFEDLQDYISDLSSPILDKKLISKDIDVVFEALEA